MTDGVAYYPTEESQPPEIEEIWPDEEEGIPYQWWYKCPICDQPLDTGECECSYCSQKIDWRKKNPMNYDRSEKVGNYIYFYKNNEIVGMYHPFKGLFYCKEKE